MFDKEEYTVRISENGTKHYRKGDCLHRINGPAVECINGYQAYYQKGLRHRLNGPAIVDANGNQGWYIQGLRYTEEEFLAFTQPHYHVITE